MTDQLDCNTIAAEKIQLYLQGGSSSFFDWKNYGIRVHCPKGAVSKDTEMAITAIIGSNFKVPKDTELVSAVYGISVSNPLLKPLVLELQHCVDLRFSCQAGCLRFVRAPLEYPYQFSLVEGGFFEVGSRYGTIARDQFCCIGIVTELSNGDTSNGDDGYTPPNTTPTPGKLYICVFAPICL